MKQLYKKIYKDEHGKLWYLIREESGGYIGNGQYQIPSQTFEPLLQYWWWNGGYTWVILGGGILFTILLIKYTLWISTP